LLVPVVLLIFVKPRFQPEVIKEEPRIDLWMTAVEVISERPVFGYGVCRAEDTYRKLLFEKGIVDKYPCFEVVREKGRLLDTHNQYLQTTLDFGVAGLLLLLAIYLLPVFAVRKENRIWVGMLVVLCMFQSAFDMFLTGQFSMLFMSLMTVALHPDITAPLPVAKTDD
ncbi:MAG: O-antigen ligase family protein, partial [Paludibacteraceae bacterium]|nr:O-antigen ligase family protein [Paludibacteraceae bacterium]